MQYISHKKMIAGLVVVGVVVGLVAAGAWVAPAAAGNPGSDPFQEGGLPLTETYTLKNGYSFGYPQGWEIAYELTEPDISLAQLGSNAAVANEGGFFYDFAPGDVWVDFTWEALGNFSGVDANSSPVDVLNASIVGLYPDMAEAYEFPLGDRTAAIAEGVHESGTPMMAIFFFWDADTICSLLVLTAPGEYEQAKPTLLAIAESAIPAETASAITVPEILPGTTLNATPDAVSEEALGPMPVPDSINGPEDCHNVAVSIGDYSSEYGGPDYAPANLLDGDPATGWSSLGDVAVEYVAINLDGLQTVYGVLFNSYSPSPGYETDSIKEFAIEATMPDGSARAIFKGEAAFAEGYQSYVFDPVETKQVRFVFSSTHGGAYYEAADIMVCALVGAVQTPPTTGMPPLMGGKEIRQWAARAEATSQYSATDWNAQQATGAPDTPVCGDIGTAWASLSPNSVETLTVFFDTPVIPKQVHIFQTHNPGAIASVELLLAASDPPIPIPNSADHITGCPGTFTVDVPEGLTDNRPVIGVIILLDQRDHPGWNEIDAVELVGYAP